MSWLKIIINYYPPAVPVLNFSYLLILNFNNIYYQVGGIISFICLIWLYIGKQENIKKFKKMKGEKDLGDFFIFVARYKVDMVIGLVSIILFLWSIIHIYTIGTRILPYIYILGIINLAQIIIIPARLYHNSEAMRKVFRWVRSWI